MTRDRLTRPMVAFDCSICVAFHDSKLHSKRKSKLQSVATEFDESRLPACQCATRYVRMAQRSSLNGRQSGHFDAYAFHQQYRKHPASFTHVLATVLVSRGPLPHRIRPRIYPRNLRHPARTRRTASPRIGCAAHARPPPMLCSSPREGRRIRRTRRTP